MIVVSATMVWRQPWSAKIVVVQTDWNKLNFLKAVAQSMYKFYATDSFIVLVEAYSFC
jgi:hypothetical protein